MTTDITRYFIGILNESEQIQSGMSMNYLGNLSDQDCLVFRTTFMSAEHIQIKGWLVAPKNKKYKGAILQFPAYAEVLFPLLGYTNMGLVTMSISVRGHHGSDCVVNPGFPGLLIHGLPHADRYIYRHIFIDTLRGLDELLKFLDQRVPIVALGRSQGAALSLLLSAYRDEITAVSAEVPWLCSIEDSINLTDGFPYRELKTYLQDNPQNELEALSTINLFDVCNHASLIDCPVLLGLGVDDPVTPISSTRKLASRLRNVITYEYEGAGHEGGGLPHRKIQFEWIKKIVETYQ